MPQTSRSSPGEGWTGSCQQRPTIADSPDGPPIDAHYGTQEHNTHLLAVRNAHFATYMYISIHSRILHTDYTARLCAGRARRASKAELRYASILLQIRQFHATCVQRLVRPRIQECHNNPAHFAVTIIGCPSTTKSVLFPPSAKCPQHVDMQRFYLS